MVNKDVSLTEYEPFWWWPSTKWEIMRKTLIILVSAAFVTGTFLSGCDMLDANSGTSLSKGQQVPEYVVEARLDLKRSIDQFKLESDKAIALNEKRIEEFKLKRADEMKENQASYDKKVAALESKNTELKMKLTNYIVDQNWETFKVEFNQDIIKLDKALGDLTVNNVN
jgi:hypothetical protein